MPSSELVTFTVPSRMLMYCASIPSFDSVMFRVPPEISSTRSALKPSSPAEMFTVPPLRRTQPRLPSVSLVALMPSLVAVTVTVPSRIST